MTIFEEDANKVGLILLAIKELLIYKFPSKISIKVDSDSLNRKEEESRMMKD